MGATWLGGQFFHMVAEHGSRRGVDERESLVRAFQDDPFRHVAEDVFIETELADGLLGLPLLRDVLDDAKHPDRLFFDVELKPATTMHPADRVVAHPDDGYPCQTVSFPSTRSPASRRAFRRGWLGCTMLSQPSTFLG